MSADNIATVSDEQRHLPAELQGLWEEQIKLVRRGDISGFEILCERANSLVERIALAGILESAEFKNRREQLQRLYKDLCLAVTDQKASTGEKLNRIRKGKKTLATYRNNVRL